MPLIGNHHPKHGRKYSVKMRSRAIRSTLKIDIINLAA